MTCIRSTATSFREFVAGAAPAAYDIETNNFHGACYMWWDIFPTWGSDLEPEIAEACLKTMMEVLALPTELCQLSALHGLNHWARPGRHGSEAGRIIDAFLDTAQGLTPRIREYAALARRGLAQ